MTDLNLDPDNILPPERGRILVASPHLEDPYFKRTVILLCEHNAEGSFGFVLNRYIDLDLPDLNVALPATEGRISLGGPVENNSLYYVHSVGPSLPDSQHIVDQLHLGGDFDNLADGLRNGSIADAQVRFFVGYSGWGEGQLDDEIAQRSWYVRPLDNLPLMDSHFEDLWREALRSMGGAFTHLAHFPADPKLN